MIQEKIITTNNYKIYKYGLSNWPLHYTAVFPLRSFGDIISMEEIYDCDFPLELRKIFSKFVNYVDPLNLEYVLHNLESVSVVYTDKKDDLNGFASNQNWTGSYKPFHNQISIFEKNDLTLSHEFLHMASTSPTNPPMTGFSIVSLDNEKQNIIFFGDGLNEGYTELLNIRIFGNDRSQCAYAANVRIVRLLECFFDNYRDMEWAYFHNNIDLLYRAFCKYGTRSEFFTIINQLDLFLNDYDPITYYKVLSKLHDIIKRSNDPDKIRKFEEILYKDSVYNLASKLDFAFGDLESIDSFEKK